MVKNNQDFSEERARNILKVVSVVMPLVILGVFIVLGFFNFDWLTFFGRLNSFHWFLIFLFFIFLILGFSEISFKNKFRQDVSLVLAFLFFNIVGISFTGGLESPLYLFLLFGIIISGLIFSLNITLLISAIVAGFYLVEIIFEYFSRRPQFLPPYWKTISPWWLADRLFIYITVFFLVALITNYFSEAIKRKNRNLEEAFSELKEAQSQLIQSEKMASLGVLSSGISHELKNPITGILGFSELAIKRIKDIGADEQLSELIQEIYLNSQHCREIIKNMLDFARVSDKEERFEKVNVIQVVKGALKIIKHQLDIQNITVKEPLTQEEIFTSGLPTQLSQVFLNILSNAKDALPTGGEIEIEITESSDLVKLVFKDTGAGMTGEVLKKVFEPFFTTKEKGKGVGLGLSVSYGIILKHKGAIKIESRPNKGTQVIITLPKYKEEAG